MKKFRLIIYLSDKTGKTSEPVHFDYPSKAWCNVQWRKLKANKAAKAKELFEDSGSYSNIHKFVKEL